MPPRARIELRILTRVGVAVSSLSLFTALSAAASTAANVQHRPALMGTPIVSASSDFNNDGYADLAIGSYGEDIGANNDAGSVNVIYGTSNGLDDDGNQFWTAGTNGVQGAGSPDAGFGRTLAAGDFDGNGYTDLAIGAHQEDVSTTDMAGAVHVLYGSSCGLLGDVSGSCTEDRDDQFLYQGATIDGGTIEGSLDASDFFGQSVDAGDFDGDGYDDLAVGAPGQDVNGNADAGAANVIYGSDTGLQAGRTGWRSDQIWAQGVNSVGDSAEENDRLGMALGVGDFDLNGADDLAVGTFYEDVGGAADGGAVTLLYGTTTNGLQASSPNDWFLTQDAADVQDQAESDDWFGRDLVGGDFNDDGYDDLAIGAYHEDLALIQDAGSVNVLYGSSSGLQAASPDDQFWTEDTSGVNNDDGAEAGDNLGREIAAGDFNAATDDYDDLAIGIPGEDIVAGVTLEDAGGVLVLYGGNGGLQASSPDDAFGTQNSPTSRRILALVTSSPKACGRATSTTMETTI